MEEFNYTKNPKPLTEKEIKELASKIIPDTNEPTESVSIEELAKGFAKLKVDKMRMFDTIRTNLKPFFDKNGLILPLTDLELSKFLLKKYPEMFNLPARELVFDREQFMEYSKFIEEQLTIPKKAKVSKGSTPITSLHGTELGLLAFLNGDSQPSREENKSGYDYYSKVKNESFFFNLGSSNETRAMLRRFENIKASGLLTREEPFKKLHEIVKDRQEDLIS